MSMNGNTQGLELNGVQKLNQNNLLKFAPSKISFVIFITL